MYPDTYLFSNLFCVVDYSEEEDLYASWSPWQGRERYCEQEPSPAPPTPCPRTPWRQGHYDQPEGLFSKDPQGMACLQEQSRTPSPDHHSAAGHPGRQIPLRRTTGRQLPPTPQHTSTLNIDNLPAISVSSSPSIRALSMAQIPTNFPRLNYSPSRAMLSNFWPTGMIPSTFTFRNAPPMHARQGRLAVPDNSESGRTAVTAGRSGRQDSLATESDSQPGVVCVPRVGISPSRVPARRQNSESETDEDDWC